MTTKDIPEKWFCETKRHKHTLKENRVEMYSHYTRLFFTVSIALILLFSGIGVVSAIDYCVSTDGNDSYNGIEQSWQHLYYAAQQVQAGDTICLVNGTWIKDYLKFVNSGNATHPITVTAYNGTPTIDGVDGSSITGVITQAVNNNPNGYIDISNLKMENVFKGFMIEYQSHDINISDCNISSNQYSFHVYGTEVNDIHIKNCTCQSTDTTAIGSTYSTDLTISNCTVLSSGWNGQSINYGNNSIIVNGTAISTFHNGFQMSSVDYGVMKNCVAKSIGDNGYYLFGNHNNIVEDCIANYTTGRGMTAANVENLTIRRWHSWDCAGSGINIHTVGTENGILTSRNVNLIDSIIEDNNPAKVTIKIDQVSTDVRIVNTKWDGVIGLAGTEMDYTVLYYLDVLVQDENWLPISGANVTVSHPNVSIDWYGNGSEYVDFEQKPINLYTVPLFPSYTDGLLQPQNISQTTTGDDGHTPLPLDRNTTLVIADYRVERHGASWYQHPLVTTNFNNWTLTAEKDGVIATVTGIDPDASWYREDPTSYPGESKGTVIITLPTTVESPTTNVTITPTPDETGWNNITPVVITSFRSGIVSAISYTNYSKMSETGPWTMVTTSAVTGPDAENVTAISESGFNVTLSDEGITQIWYHSVDTNSNIETTKDVTVKIDTTSTDPEQPDWWGYYVGCGEGTWGRTTAEAKTGNYSAFLKGTAYEYETDHINLGLIAGKSNGYSGPDAYTAIPNTTYTLSFWLKGDFTKIDVYAMTWNTENGSGGRSWGSTSIGWITPTETWTKYEGTFTTASDAKKFVVLFKANGDSTQENLGTIYVDDVDVNIGAGNLIMNPGAEGTDFCALSGTVTTNTTQGETGLANATVTLTTVEGTEINTTQTDSTGRYEFTDVSPGNYNINATKRSYWPDSDPVTVTAESPETADIVLCQKGDLNTNNEPADAGDLAMMADATAAGTSDETYDLDGDGNPADEADLTLLKDVSVGVAVLE